MVAPLTIVTNETGQTQAGVSPLSFILVVPHTDSEAVPTTLAAPANELTAITSSNETSQLSDGFARKAYDHIELASSSNVFVLPFAVESADTTAERAAKVVAALNVLDTVTEKAKLPHRGTDFIVVPREVAAEATTSSIFAKLKTFSADTSLGAMSIVDAGPIDATMNKGEATAPTQGEAVTWEQANSDENILIISNRADVAGYDNMWGSVIAAEQMARYSAARGLHAHPFNLRNNVLGVSNIQPVRTFDPLDGSSEAVTLAASPNHMTSIVTWEGQHYLWGGSTQNDTSGSALRFVANNLVSKRIKKDAIRDIVPFLGLRGTRRTIEALQGKVERDLQATYIPDAVDRIYVADPVLTGNSVTVTIYVLFHGFIEFVKLVVEVEA